MSSSDAKSINNDFTQKDILSLSQFDRTSLETLFDKTTSIKGEKDLRKLLQILEGRVVTLLFYEPSSRTRGSFDAAVQRLGGRTLIINVEASSVAKGETLEDTIKTFENYSDAIVIRHSELGAAAKAAKVSNIPIFNAGDGIGEHPTQALLDMFTIFEKKKSLSGLVGLVAGDLKHGRTVHSLLKGLSLFENNVIYLLSPDQLRLDPELKSQLEEKGLKLFEIESVTDIPKDTDFWYWTRVQKERFSSEVEYKKVNNKFVVNNELLSLYAGPKTIIMHPLPRVGEIATEVDKDPRAVYLTDQMKNGMYVRMALLSLILSPV